MAAPISIIGEPRVVGPAPEISSFHQIEFRLSARPTEAWERFFRHPAMMNLAQPQPRLEESTIVVAAPESQFDAAITEVQHRIAEANERHGQHEAEEAKRRAAAAEHERAEQAAVDTVNGKLADAWKAGSEVK